ncbi:MAG TPA: noncanonical pyrimidine nucleotidase, YjjG family [Candidatus Scatavimonas merdigallinarum]|uniref:Noncanonical pyrimidine nucleotidase, YjjG family n=1 Tax=Candidatus Scatavimonas merdigallinarum TaxID=2840914 RepID=A0A9D1CVM4_9FIRM|nr:noncanonical pyrimidine nucleotidase, YjjG family [Candidatus Scatavimonas merdigallinarum]
MGTVSVLYRERKAKFHTVLLDADQTLFDFNKSQRLSLKAALQKNGYPWNEEMNALYSKENLMVWKKFERGEITKERLKIERFENFFYKLGYKNADIAAVNADYIFHLSQCGFTIDGADTLCRALHGVCKLYIATNGIQSVQERRLEKSNIKPYIDGMFISDVLGCQKPAKEYFAFIFHALQIADKSGVIILGDSLTSDMQGGKNAGITTCLFDPEDTVRMPQPLCDFKITKLLDFLPIVFDA